MAALFVAGCNSGGSPPPPTTYTIGGKVSGLSGTGLVLQDNGADYLRISANGAFTFTTPIASGGAYAVTVLTQPSSPTQTCTVANGSGTASANVTNIQVTCKATVTGYTIGGTVSGLTDTGLVLVYNDTPVLPVSANGAFTFSTPIQSGVSYQVEVVAPPSSPGLESCTVTNGSGVATSDITNIQVACVPLPAPPPISLPGGAVSEWAWVGGSNVFWSDFNMYGWYGTKGIGATINDLGQRLYASTGTDAAGNFWLFGGYSYQGPIPESGDMNDLWKFDGSGWTWMSGSNDPEQAGIYGILGTAAPGNVPGARFQAASWMDSQGNFWIFGGLGIDSTGNRGDLEDLWKYDTNTGQWTWMSGSKVAANPGVNGAFQGTGVYGVQGTPDPANLPGARVDANTWSDPSGNLWLFGGFGVDANGSLGQLNDLWKSNNGEWTWMSGSNVVNQFGTYGTLGTAAPGNAPGARTNAVTWTDKSGNLWLFGGAGNDENGLLCNEFLICNLNDLWKFSAGEWIWMGGPKIGDEWGTYGI
jgi:hypothetical protein